MLGDELVGALALRDVERRALLPLHPLREDPRHEQRVVPDVSADADLVLGTELRNVGLPRALDLEHHVDDALESRQAEPPWVEILGSRESCQEIGQVRDGGVSVEREIMEARAERPIEEASQLHRRHGR
jgi:hypothetical protein